MDSTDDDLTELRNIPEIEIPAPDVIPKNEAISALDLSRGNDDECREADPEDDVEDACVVTLEEGDPELPGFDETNVPEVKPISYNTYWNLIEANVNFKQVTQPHSCTYHRRAPFVEGALKRIKDSRVNGAYDQMNCRQKLAIDKLNAALDHEKEEIDRHFRQFQTQRAYLQQVEKNLPRRSDDQFEIIVYEDYVGTYGMDAAVKRVNNLVMTFIWKDENNIIQRKYINNITASSDETFKADAQCTQNIWDFHLKPNQLMHELKTMAPNSDRAKQLRDELQELKARMNGVFEFEGVTKITRSGDSGSHFHNRLMLVFESGFLSALE